MYAKQSTAKTFLVGPILDADGVAKTDEVVGSIKVTKNGTVGAVDAQDTLTHNHTGHYVFVSDGGDFDTVGEVEFSLNSTTNAMAPVTFQVLPANVYDSLVGGTDTLQVETTSIAANAITATAIADDAITAAKLNTGAITADAFAADAIVAATLATGAITADAFAADAIVAATLATGVLTADAFAADSIVAATLATGALTADAFAANAITNAAVADDVDVNAKTITDGAITAAAIATGAIDADALATDAVAEMNAPVLRAISTESPRGRWRSLVKYSSNPLTFPLDNGEIYPCHPNVFRYTSGIYKYIALYTPASPLGDERPYIARSTDGYTWVTTGVTNPVLASGGVNSWNEQYNPDPDMVYSADHSKWFMVSFGTTLSDLPAYRARIALASSTDGITWTWYDGAAVDGNTSPVIIAADGTTGEAWELYGGISRLRTPTIYYESGTFYVFYTSYLPVTGAPVGDCSPMGLATFTVNVSTGAVENFARAATNPIFTLAEDEYLYGGCSHPFVCKSGSTYLMYVTRVAKSKSLLAGGNPRVGCLLTSTDLLTWTYRGPVLGIGEPGDWDSFAIHRIAPVCTSNKQVELQQGRLQAYYSAFKDTVASEMDIGIAYGYGLGIDMGDVLEDTGTTLPATLATIEADTNEVQAELADGGRTDLLIDGIAAKTTNLPASPAAVGSAMTVSDKTGFKLASDGLDQLSAVPVANATTWAERMNWVAQKLWYSSKTPTEIVVKDNAGAVLTTQAITDDSAGTETMGPPV